MQSQVVSKITALEIFEAAKKNLKLPLLPWKKNTFQETGNCNRTARNEKWEFCFRWQVHASRL